MRVGGPTARQQLLAGVAVDQRVVHLDVDREPAAFEAFDEVHFPWRTTQVKGITVQAGHQDSEFTFIAWAGQRRTPYVVVQLEVVVIHPGLDRA
ncbi:MAG: hypothetical protein QOF15_385, partial [Mycobacterium sp.]|nr:hypothetical protein [Mycobacterium sp.]